MTPREGHAGFDRVIIVAQPFRKPLQGHEGTLRRPCQPRLQLVRLALAHALGEILGSDDGGSHLGMRRVQLGELGGLVIILPLWSPQDQPGRSTGGQLAVRRRCDDRQCLARRPVVAGLAWRLAHALGLTRHGRVAPSIPTLLDLPEELSGVTVPRIPAVQEIRVRGREDAAAASGAALALRQRGDTKIPKHGILANPQVLGHGPPRPPLLVEGPDLLMECQPPRLALVRELLGCARRGGGWHRDGYRAVGLRHWRLAQRLIDGFEGLTMGVEYLVKGCREVLQQVKTIGDLNRVGGALPGSVCVSSGPITGDHADTRMDLQPEREGLGLTIGQEGERSLPFEVDQHGPRGLAFPVGPVVDTEHLRGSHIWHGQTAQQAQEGIPTDDQAETTAQSCPRCPAQRQGDVHQPVCQPRCPSRPGCDEP